MGNDLLDLALCARCHDRMLYYVLMATAGSLIGCFATDSISRKGEGGQKKFLSGNHLAYIRELVEKRAALMLVVASLVSPPFPFTAFVAAAAAFRYPRSKILSWVGVGRFIRFAIEGALAIHYGRWIIQQAESPFLDHLMIALVAISIGASAFAIYRWKWRSLRRSMKYKTRTATEITNAAKNINRAISAVANARTPSPRNPVTSATINNRTARYEKTIHFLLSIF